MKPRRIFVSAGEVSGDEALGAILAALRSRLPGLELCGLGGPAAASQGLEPLVPLARTAVSGIGDVAASAFALLKARRAAIACLESRPRPDLALLVDYPGFNLTLARRALAAGIPVYYVAPPQAWIYRNPSAKAARANRSLRGAAVHVLYPFEKETFAASASEVVGGHFLDEALSVPLDAPVAPLEGRAAPAGDAAEGDSRRGLLALCPGSRLPALRRNLPAWLAALRRGGVLDDPAVAGVRILVPPHLAEAARSAAPRSEIVTDKGRLLREARWAFAFPGTITLELALAGIPAAVMAALDPLTLAVGRRVVKGPWLGLPNLLLGREAFPEWAGRTSALAPEVAAGLWQRLRNLSSRGAAEASGTLRRLMGPADGARVAAEQCLKILEKS